MATRRDATRTRSRNRRRTAGRRARAIAGKLKLRDAQQREEAQATVQRITGELAALAEAAMREADTVARNARRALSKATGHAKGRLHRAINELHTTLQRTRRVRGPDPQPPGRRDARQRSSGSPAAPGTVTADRGYGEARVEDDLQELGVRGVAIARKRNPAPRAASSNTDEPSATRSNGEPDPKAGSTTSNAATAGTAPNSPPSPAPEPGADTASSPTTRSRAEHSPHKITAQHRSATRIERPSSGPHRNITRATTTTSFLGRSSRLVTS